MKVKALIACVGRGYDLKAEEVAEVKRQIGEKLVKFGYAEEIPEEENNTDQQPVQEIDEDSQVPPESHLTVDDLPHKSGWYELPNGEKVQGREKAEEALAEFYKEKSDE